MSKTGKMTKKMSRVLMIVSAVLLVGAVLTACGVAGLFNMPALELPTDAPVVEENPVIDPSVPSDDGNAEVPEKPVLKEEDKVKPDYSKVGAGEAHLPSLNDYGQYDGYGVYNWGQLKTMIGNLNEGISATYVIGIDLVADSTITVKTGTNVTLTSITNIAGDRKNIKRKVIKSGSAVDVSQSFVENFFRIEEGATLTIQHLTLDGMGNDFVNASGAGVYACYSLVNINEKTTPDSKSALFVLEEGGVLTNNRTKKDTVPTDATLGKTDTSGNRAAGGGVYVSAGATFVMNGGEISYIKGSDLPRGARDGGGDQYSALNYGAVFVGRENIRMAAWEKGPIPGYGRGQFFMYGGEMLHNTGGGNGAGVGVGGDVYLDGGRIAYTESAYEPVFYVAGVDKNYDRQMGLTDSPNYDSSIRGSVTIYSGELDHNSSPSYSVAMVYGEFTLWDADIHDNSGSTCMGVSPPAQQSTGAKASMTIVGGNFYNNNTTGIFTCNGAFTMWDGNVYNNVCTNAPIGVSGNETRIYGGNFYNNSVKNNGGAMSVAGGTCYIYDANFTYNTAFNNAGAVYIRSEEQRRGGLRKRR